MQPFFGTSFTSTSTTNAAKVFPVVSLFASCHCKSCMYQFSDKAATISNSKINPYNIILTSSSSKA